jgi:hypothetical protein
VLRALAVAATLLLVAGAARAEWSMFGEYQRFRWTEPTIGVKEKGPLWGIGLNWDQDKPERLAFRYRGKYYFGRVDYDGSTLITNQPVQTQVDYDGLLNELQLTYRRHESPTRVGVGFGLDYWNRQLSDVQREEWWVYFVRVGAEWTQRYRDGWFFGGGIKYPFYVYENPHATSIGFTEETKLYPEGKLSLYADLGYRRGYVMVSAFYDSWRFEQSATERTSGPPCVAAFGTQTCGLFQPASNADMYGIRLHVFF